MDRISLLWILLRTHKSTNNGIGSGIRRSPAFLHALKQKRRARSPSRARRSLSDQLIRKTGQTNNRRMNMPANAAATFLFLKHGLVSGY